MDDLHESLTREFGALQRDLARIERLEAQIVSLRETLREFRDHVIKHARSWDDSENGSHHHPIWPKVADALSSTGEG